MKKTLIILLFTALSLLLVSCAAPESSSSEPVPAPAPAPAPMPAPSPTPAPAPLVGAVPEEGEGAVSVDQPGSTSERMIVREGTLQLIVVDVNDVIDRIEGLTANLGGYVVSSNSWREGERLVGEITVRVPAEDFNMSMDTIRGMAVDVVRESTFSQDVTEEYVDLSAKLNNLEATEEQLLRLMEKADDVEDILAVQKELSRTREEIERTIGRMQLLERTSEMSLINVRLQQSKVDVNFNVDTRRIERGEEVRFISEVAGGFAPYSFQWDFGDGSSSTEADPAHSYGVVDSYTVTLTVTDDRGNTDTETREGYITVLPGWNPGNIISSAWSGLVTFVQIMGSAGIWLAVFSPVWGVALIIFFWLRRKKKKASK